MGVKVEDGVREKLSVNQKYAIQNSFQKKKKILARKKKKKRKVIPFEGKK